MNKKLEHFLLDLPLFLGAAFILMLLIVQPWSLTTRLVVGAITIFAFWLYGQFWCLASMGR
jgi:hypothetical protein